MHKINGDYEYMRECPHCGETQQLSVLDRPADCGEEYYAQCDSCLSRGPIAGSAKAAVNNWNKRPQVKLQTGVVGVHETIGEGVPF